MLTSAGWFIVEELCRKAQSHISYAESVERQARAARDPRRFERLMDETADYRHRAADVRLSILESFPPAGHA